MMQRVKLLRSAANVGLDENEFPVPLVLRKVHFAMGGMLGNEKEILQRRRNT
jgi:hypothetical protein